ncbi:MAG TPA: BamA/TamA family outer membrane protein, partial [Ignavibacteriaceae bacterium]|nr:BamA/TamA family outer membrane protein [Ignavibacteriaceae bacterium]
MRKIQGLILIFFFLNTIYGQDSVRQQAGLDWEVFPIISYDTDAGFGYGLKGYLKNIFNWQESYDLILYNSTKGEKWYRFQFSLPDYEIRHGKNYGFAFDLIADYDKWISYYFYGLGNNSSYEGREIYTKELFEFTLLLNKSLSENIIIQGGLIYKTVLFTSFPVQSLPANFSFINKANQLSFLINTIYDTRNSTINPDKGMVVSAGFESAPDFKFTNSSFSKTSLIFQSYNQIVLPVLILANRISLQQLIGNNIPVQFLLPLG